jgi:hypothetical protein
MMMNLCPAKMNNLTCPLLVMFGVNSEILKPLNPTVSDRLRRPPLKSLGMPLMSDIDAVRTGLSTAGS